MPSCRVGVPWLVVLLLFGLVLFLSFSTPLALTHQVDCSSIATCTSAMLEHARITYSAVTSLSRLQQQQVASEAQAHNKVELIHNIVRLTSRKENSADQVIAIATFLLGKTKPASVEPSQPGSDEPAGESDVCPNEDFIAYETEIMAQNKAAEQMMGTNKQRRPTFSNGATPNKQTEQGPYHRRDNVKQEEGTTRSIYLEKLESLHRIIRQAQATKKYMQTGVALKLVQDVSKLTRLYEKEARIMGVDYIVYLLNEFWDNDDNDDSALGEDTHFAHFVSHNAHHTNVQGVGAGTIEELLKGFQRGLQLGENMRSGKTQHFRQFMQQEEETEEDMNELDRLVLEIQELQEMKGIDKKVRQERMNKLTERVLDLWESGEYSDKIQVVTYTVGESVHSKNATSEENDEFGDQVVVDEEEQVEEVELDGGDDEADDVARHNNKQDDFW